MESYDWENFSVPGFGGQYFLIAVLEFSMLRPQNDAHILQGLLNQPSVGFFLLLKIKQEIHIKKK